MKVGDKYIYNGGGAYSGQTVKIISIFYDTISIRFVDKYLDQMFDICTVSDDVLSEIIPKSHPNTNIFK